MWKQLEEFVTEIAGEVRMLVRKRFEWGTAKSVRKKIEFGEHEIATYAFEKKNSPKTRPGRDPGCELRDRKQLEMSIARVWVFGAALSYVFLQCLFVLVPERYNEHVETFF